MARVLIGAVVVAVLLTVFAIVDCSFTERRGVRGLPRWAWLVLIVVAPIVGAILWLSFGRARGGGRPIGPDDDPRFHRGPSPAPSGGDDEALRMFEQDLVDLDIETDDDDPR